MPETRTKSILHTRLKREGRHRPRVVNLTIDGMDLIAKISRASSYHPKFQAWLISTHDVLAEQDPRVRRYLRQLLDGGSARA